MFLEDIFDEELGAAPSKGKKRRQKRRQKIKKAFKAIASGGASLAVDAIKKKKKGGKILGKIKGVAKGALSLGGCDGYGIREMVDAGVPKADILAAAKVLIKRVKSKRAGDCTCQRDLAKTVAAKLVADLGPPLNAANKALAKLELQRKATFEHQKLMNDADFRRKVLGFIAQKGACGNQSAQRTISLLRG